jgi:cyclophilin family peptidyl-prolyl cis-trans isomerase
LGLLPLFFLLACGGDGSSASSPPRTPTPGVSQTATCGPAGSAIARIERDGRETVTAAPEMLIDPVKSYVAVMETTKGDITIDLAAAGAPNTVNNFVYLSCAGYYDGLTFHRYDPGFVIQGGDPRGDGSGGPPYIFANETSTALRHDVPGVIAMANSGPDTNGSQFYFTLNPAPGLDGRYNVFGRVTEGIDTVRALRRGDRILGISIEER